MPRPTLHLQRRLTITKHFSGKAASHQPPLSTKQDDVGTDVHPWPRPPTTALDEQDNVGADVYPWPRPPTTALDEQDDDRGTMNFGSVLYIIITKYIHTYTIIQKAGI
jgi:hypothetical protein